jgi:peroxiredoxin
MRGIVVGLALLLHGHIVLAAPAESLVQKAGLSPSVSSQLAADFQLPSLTGDKLRLHDQRGKVVFLNFWATWCPPCRYEMPEMERLFQSLSQQPFVMWAVAMQESHEQVAPFIKGNRLHFPALLDLDGTVSARYAIRGLPTTYVIDCSGNLVGRAVGPRPWNSTAVRTLLAALLSDTHCR